MWALCGVVLRAKPWGELYRQNRHTRARLHPTHPPTHPPPLPSAWQVGINIPIPVPLPYFSFTGATRQAGGPAQGSTGGYKGPGLLLLLR